MNMLKDVLFNPFMFILAYLAIWNIIDTVDLFRGKKGDSYVIH